MLIINSTYDPDAGRLSGMSMVTGSRPAKFEARRNEAEAPTTAMTHVAIQENLDGKVVDWLEKVSDERYRTCYQSVATLKGVRIMASAPSKAHG